MNFTSSLFFSISEEVLPGLGISKKSLIYVLGSLQAKYLSRVINWIIILMNGGYLEDALITGAFWKNIVRFVQLGQAECMRCPRVLQSEWRGHYFWPYFLFLSFIFLISSLLFSQKVLSKGSEILHGLLSYQNNMNPQWKKKYCGTPLPPALCYIWADEGGYFQKLS